MSFIPKNKEKMKNTKITLVKNLLGKYIVTLWLDYEYGKFSERQSFSDKDLAAAWLLIQKL